MIDTISIDCAIRRLDAMNRPGLRKDLREAAHIAKHCIIALAADAAAEPRRLRFIAQQIAEYAAVKPVMVYRTKRTREYRWRPARSKSTAKIGPHRIIGYYDEGANWRDIYEDLKQ